MTRRLDDLLNDMLRNPGASLRWGTIASSDPLVVRLGGTTLSRLAKLGTMPAVDEPVLVLFDGRIGVALGIDVYQAPADDPSVGQAGSGGMPKWEYEQLDITSTYNGTWVLLHIPIEKSEIVRLNGVTLTEHVDYSVTGGTITFTNTADLLLGIGGNTWSLDVTYPYLLDNLGEQDGWPSENVPDATPDLFFMAAAGGGGGVGTITGVPAITNREFAILVTRSDTTSVSGVFATWTKIRSGSSVDIWTGTGVGTGTTITTNGTTPYTPDAVVAVYTGISTIAIDDLTTTSYASAFNGQASAASATPTDNGCIAFSAVVATHGFLNGFYPTGVHTETGFTALGSAANGGPGSAGQGIAATTGLSVFGTPIDGSFTVAEDGSHAGTAEAINVTFTWTPA